MGEVVSANFRRKEAIPSLVQIVEEDSVSDAQFIKDHLDILALAIEIESDFTDFIERLGEGVVTNKNVDLRREGLREKSLQDLCTIWITSRETDWKRNPSFYVAVVLERAVHTEALGEDFG